MTRFFCPQLLAGITTNTTGTLRPCCASMESISSIVMKSDNSPFRAWDDWGEFMNSPQMKKWRVEMENGIWPDICRKCEINETANQSSRRTHLIDKVKRMGISLPEMDDSGKIINLNFSLFDLRLGNLCNLQCQMCNGYASSRWQASHLTEFFDNDPPLDPLSIWPDKYTSWFDQLLHHADSIKELYFTGGEPMMISSHWKLLTKLIETGNSKNIHIKYNTNATLWNNDWVKLWLEFASVTFQVSVDGIDYINDWIRWPSKWKDVQKTIQNIENTCLTYPEKINWSISCTLQRSNAWNLKEFQEWTDQYTNRSVHIEFLYYPLHLSICSWNDSERKKWTEWVNGWANHKFEKIHKISLENFKNIQTPFDHEMENKFQKYISWWERHTKLAKPDTVR